jgi:hypothetical protein
MMWYMFQVYVLLPVFNLWCDIYFRCTSWLPIFKVPYQQWRWSGRYIFIIIYQELPTLPEQMSSPLIFSGVRFTRSLAMFCRSLFVLLTFGHCVVCPSIYEFELLFWYLVSGIIYTLSRSYFVYIYSGSIFVILGFLE